MSNTNESSTLHTLAAHEHEAAAKLHHEAAAHQGHENLEDAKKCAKRAMGSSSIAHEKSTNACISSAK